MPFGIINSLSALVKIQSDQNHVSFIPRALSPYNICDIVTIENITRTVSSNYKDITWDQRISLYSSNVIVLLPKQNNNDVCSCVQSVTIFKAFHK